MDTSALRKRAQDYIEKEQNEVFRNEVKQLLESNNEKELEDRFYRDLEFGTGGLRGIIGGGYNRMNSLVVKRATQGLANYLIKTFPQKASTGKLSAAIAYDSRRYSPEFAEAAALVLGANGIKTYLFSSLRPTPVLSYTIIKLNCDTGIVCTASHNPAQYNGYKAYWNDGAQIVSPHDTGIIDEVTKVEAIKDIDKKTALEKGLLVMIDKEIDEPYADMVRSHLFRPELIKAKGSDVKIVYSPLHGTGARPVENILGSLGLKIITVPEQREGDGDFPTVKFPNPEEAAALEMALELGKKVQADVVMATDPDADRLGIAVPDGKGAFSLLSGNQLGTLLADYIFLSMKEKKTLPAKPAMINSIVTTGMQKRVAAAYGAECFECLTGFKWIADLWQKIESDGSGYTVVYGTEESYGYLIEPEVRDKDGISAAALTAEMTLYWRSKGMSLPQRLDELYMDHGYWQEFGISKYFQGAEGSKIMAGIMQQFRQNPPETLGGIKVEKVRDILESVWKSPSDPSVSEPVKLPKSNVLQFFLEDGTVVSARPSGTEPKIKFYATCCAETKGTSLEAAKQSAREKLIAIETELRKVIGD